MILIDLLIVFAFIMLIVMLAIAILNAITLPRLRSPAPDAAPPLIHPSADTPLVSILIAARDEANQIAATIRTLRAQTYAPFEVLILDDQSSDSTGAIARAAAEGDVRFRVIDGQPLLDGWLRRNWARHQLAHEAKGRVLVFADTDISWQPDALRALIAEMNRPQADLLTVWATPITGDRGSPSRGERLVVPLIALAQVGCLPAMLVHSPRYPFVAVANGQCLVFRKTAYQAVGGQIAVRGSKLAGIEFARRIKAKGLRLRIADGAGLITCRSSRSWSEVRDDFADDLLAICGGRIGVLVLATLFALLIFVLPWLWLVFGGLTHGIGGYPLVPLALVALGISLRVLSAWVTRQRVSDALWLPISVLLLAWITLRIAAQALWWHDRGSRRLAHKV